MAIASPPPESPPLPDESSWGATSWLDAETVAWLASLAVHLCILTAAATLTLALPGRSKTPDLTIEPIDLAEDEPLPEELLASIDLHEAIGQLAQAGEESALASAPQLADESLVIFETTEVAEVGELPALDAEVEIFQGPETNDRLPVEGVGSVGASGAAGAVDRITQEILTSLDQRKTLVVWLFDESGSLKEERKQIIRRFERIYDELGIIEAADNPAFRRHQDKPLLTAVIGFGARSKLMTPEPTDQLPEILEAVRSIREDEDDPARGVENVFTAVGEAAERFRVYQRAKNGRRNVMIVVFTDEAGNDVDRLEETVAQCRKLAMPVYVVGRPAPFGRRSAYVKYVDPDPRFDQRPQWVPVDMGPETLLPERLKLDVASRGRDSLIDSGFGPYALTRLCYETGGLYFAAHPNRTVGEKVSAAATDNLSAHFQRFFNPLAMRRYQPDYLPVEEYLQLARANGARRALLEAAELSWMTPMENIRLRFPKRDEASLAQSLSRAQRSAALLQPRLNQLCDVLLRGEKDREQLERPRWQAGYDLALGRALAVKVRTDGYNAMLALAKQGMPFEDEKNNVWTLRPADQYADSTTERLAEKARLYLERTVAEHPETPWALLAEEELARPLGWKWTESYTPMAPEATGNGNRRPRPERPEIPDRPLRRDPPPL